VFIALRVWLWAAIVRPLKHVMPLPTLVRLARPRPGQSAPAHRESVERRLAGYLSQHGRFPARPPSNCLERSLAAYRLLCRVGADVRLAVGVRPREGAVDGHVWVTLDGRPFAEASDVSTYALVVAFDSQGRREAVRGGRTDLTGIRWA
jgi:Transglutaminase-like superfamily